MPSLKDILVRQASVPGGLESGLPAGFPKLSSVLSSIAGVLPVNPVLPEVPLPAGFTKSGALSQPARMMTDFIAGVEKVLPEGAPKLGASAAAMTRGGYRPVTTETGPKIPTRRILSGGYRSV